MLSSEATDVIIEQAFSLGAQGYLLKPVMLEELDAALQAVLNPRSPPRHCAAARSSVNFANPAM